MLLIEVLFGDRHRFRRSRRLSRLAFAVAGIIACSWLKQSVASERAALARVPTRWPDALPPPNCPVAKGPGSSPAAWPYASDISAGESSSSTGPFSGAAVGEAEPSWRDDLELALLLLAA